MSNNIKQYLVKRIALVFLYTGAILFVSSAGSYAQTPEYRWMDDPHEKVGLTYGLSQKVQASYLWRGLYAGGLNTQIDANVGYGGAYIDMWWSIGATDMRFREFQPEVDISLGFNRWGLNVYLLYIHNFNCGFFDFSNYPDKGNRLELDIRYTVSSKIPLTIAWATRVSAADGYLNTAGDTVMAYSSYAEVSYTQHLRDGFSLYGAVGITPWRSCYTNYERGFALNNIELRLRKDWSVHERVGLMLMGQLVVNPSAPVDVILPNIGFGVYLK